MQRQQQAAERILEDTGLTDTLTDHQARPLIDWASRTAAQVAGDVTCADAEVDRAVGAIRRAVLYVADAHADEQDGEQLVFLARQALYRLAANQGQAELFEQIMNMRGIEKQPESAVPTTEKQGDQGPSKRVLWQAHRRQLRVRLMMRRRPRRR